MRLFLLVCDLVIGMLCVLVNVCSVFYVWLYSMLLLVMISGFFVVFSMLSVLVSLSVLVGGWCIWISGGVKNVLG